jgi:hypothetical protein
MLSSQSFVSLDTNSALSPTAASICLGGHCTISVVRETEQIGFGYLNSSCRTAFSQESPIPIPWLNPNLDAGWSSP